MTARNKMGRRHLFHPSLAKKRHLAVLLTVILVISLAACSAAEETEDPAAEETESFAAAETGKAPETEQTAPADVEIQEAIDFGLVPDSLQGNYDAQISYAEFCEMLDLFVTLAAPEKLSDYRQVSENYREADAPMSRMEGALVMLYAAECCCVDTVGYQYIMPLENLIGEDVDFYEGVSWEYPLLPDIQKPYYNEALAASEDYAWRCGQDYVVNAICFAEYMSYGNGRTYFDYDERYLLNLGDAFARGDAIRAVERLYENARFSRWLPAGQAVCTVSQSAIEAGKKMPDVSWQKLPKWKGYTAAPGNWTVVYGGGVRYDRELVEVLSAQGFTFVRAPLDARELFQDREMSMVSPAWLENMDDLVEACAEAGIHVCFDLHDMPGFYTGGDDSQITLWKDEQTQDDFVAFWRFMAEYYKEIPANLLSFNLLNEPHDADGLTDEVYSAVMLKAIEAIREVTPDRLIFADMLGMMPGTPVQGLKDAQVVQTPHLYFLFDGTDEWPVYTTNGFIHRSTGTLTLNGSFPAGTKVAVSFTAVHGDSTFHINADGKSVASLALGTEAVGENGCLMIGEAGTDGEFRNYEGVLFTGELSDACSRITLTQEDGWWYEMKHLTVTMGSDTIVFETDYGVGGRSEGAPQITIDEAGNASSGNGTLTVESREWLDDVLRSFHEFTQQTGEQIMVQEFGFNETIDYQAALAAAEDLFSVLDTYEIPWCSWCTNFGPLTDAREMEWYQIENCSIARAGADYQMVSDHWMMDTGLMEVFQRHMQ